MTKKIAKMVFTLLFMLAAMTTIPFSQPIDSILNANAPARENLFDNENQTTGLPSVVRLLVALFVMAGLIGFFYFFLKKIKLKSGTTSTGNIEILEEKIVGYSGKLCLVRVSGNVFLVGVGKDNINHIHTFTDTETIDILAGYDEGHIGNSLGSFKNIINSFMSKYREKKS